MFYGEKKLDVPAFSFEIPTFSFHCWCVKFGSLEVLFLHCNFCCLFQSVFYPSIRSIPAQIPFHSHPQKDGDT